MSFVEQHGGRESRDSKSSSCRCGATYKRTPINYNSRFSGRPGPSFCRTNTTALPGVSPYGASRRSLCARYVWPARDSTLEERPAGAQRGQRRHGELRPTQMPGYPHWKIPAASTRSHSAGMRTASDAFQPPEALPAAASASRLANRCASFPSFIASISNVSGGSRGS